MGLLDPSALGRLATEPFVETAREVGAQRGASDNRRDEGRWLGGWRVQVAPTHAARGGEDAVESAEVADEPYETTLSWDCLETCLGGGGGRGGG